VVRGGSFSHRPIRHFHTGCAATEEYSFLKANAYTRTTYTIPAPSWHRIFWHSEHLRPTYPIPEDFLHAIAAYLRQELVMKLIALGCDDIQLDAPNHAPCTCLLWIGVRIVCGLIATIICLSGLVSNPQSGFVASQLWQRYSLATDEPSG
jgi:hypothetical protein